jgi:hypothetical protein
VKRLLIILGVILAILVAANFAARALAERTVSRELATTLSLSGNPSVSLGGEPFLWHAATGNIPSATIDGTDLSAGGVTFDRVHATLTDVTFPPFAVVAGHRAVIRAASGQGTATMDEAAVAALLKDRGVNLPVRLQGGRVLVTLPIVGEIPVVPTLEGNRLELRPDVSLPESITPSLSFELPAVIDGVRYTGVVVRDGTAVISFRLDRPSFVVNG